MIQSSFCATSISLSILFSSASLYGASGTSTEYAIFQRHEIHFSNETPNEYDTDQVVSSDNGRVISRTVLLPPVNAPTRIIARLSVYPVPKDELDVFDKWDRAGNVRLATPGEPDLEIIKFITAYGGKTHYEVDVSHLAPLLTGECLFKAFIDTWVSPAWEVDFSLHYQADSTASNPVWVKPLLYEGSYDALDETADTHSVYVAVPTGLSRVKLFYLVSGHCTDGRGADEFVSKDNVIAVNDIVVYRYQPWRDDCVNFRTINPYCRRWSDGSWSSDYSRSGWCPGDWVRPLQLDLTDHLTAGTHEVRFRIEDVRPRDESGNFGYWRISNYLVGWE